MVPEDPVAISFEDGQEEAERQIKLLCTRLLAGWQGLSTVDMQVSRISGGISNLLVKVEPPPHLQPVAVKVFGDKTELLIDREAEKRILLRLNGAGFGAPVIGLFSNGRVERFLEARTLTPEDVCNPAFVPHIARRLRAFHDLQLDLGSATGAVAAVGPLAATTVADLKAAAAVDARDVSPLPPRGPVCEGPQISQWDAMFGWLNMAEELSFAHDPAKQAAYDKVDFVAMRAELEDLHRVCGRVASSRVLCHNDLLSGNILVVRDQQQQQQEVAEGLQGHAALSVQETSRSGGGSEGPAAAAAAGVDAALLGGSLQFIDFEYSCYGPRGFDFGNHFNEYAGFDCEYERFPSPENQKDFFRHYLKPGELRSLAAEHLRRQRHDHQYWPQTSEPQAQEPFNNQQGTPAAPAQEPSGAAAAAEPPGAPGPHAAALEAAEEVVLERMVAETCVYALASHAYWGVWSFIQARYSSIDFDYLEYSKMRWDEYHRRKAEFYALVDSLFPL